MMCHRVKEQKLEEETDALYKVYVYALYTKLSRRDKLIYLNFRCSCFC